MLLFEPREVFPAELLEPASGMSGGRALQGGQVVGGEHLHPLAGLPLPVHPGAQQVALARWGNSDGLPANWQLDITITILPS